MGYLAKRRYPRIRFEQSGEIEYLDRTRGQRTTCPVALTTVACEGIGVTSSRELALSRKTRINVSFSLDGETLSLPGAVAWAKSGGVGIHLLLELAPPATRQRWAAWIVEKTQAQRSSRTSRVTF